MSVKPLTTTLAMLQGGMFLDKCSDLMAGIVKNVDETGKPGKLTITIEVKKTGAAVSLHPKVADKTPETPVDADLFYPTVEGNLSVDNPNQRKLDLRVAEPKKTEVRNVDMETGEIRQAS